MDRESYKLLSVKDIRSRVNDNQLGNDYIRYMRTFPKLGMTGSDMIQEIKAKVKEGK